MIAAAAPPADRPATYTRRGSTGKSLHDLAGDAGDQRRLALIALLVARAEPVPALGGIGGLRLGRIGDEETQLLGEIVHPRAGGEIVGRLGAAVQHHHERQRLVRAAARDVELVGAASGGIGVSALFEPGSFRQRGGSTPRGRAVQAVEPRCRTPHTAEDPAERLREPQSAHARRPPGAVRLIALGRGPGGSGRRRRRHHVEQGRRAFCRPLLDIALAGSRGRG